MTFDELKTENETLKAEVDRLRKLVDELNDDSVKLSYLMGFGVDNWSGYDDAISAYNNDLNE